ncbi:MAG TPA: GGDEF domain-containing protein [Campylobacterales bacterium]|nr:GGDEF domain-containing protein [Campylobacterales bacterium]HIP42228.1 GGDEF domain-containing protein [Campylobacterales bacterium]
MPLNEPIYLYLSILLLTAIIIFLVVNFCLQQYRNNLNSFIQVNTNITILSSNNEIITINRAGLDFFGFKSLEKLKQEHRSISDFFIEREGCINKYTHGKNWLTALSKITNKSSKVKMHSEVDNMPQFFYIKVSKMKHKGEYLISFNNISELEREKEEIKSKADHDALTKIYNRVKFDAVFPMVVDKALLHDEPFTLILFDIDHFKSVNDTHGHNVGDKVLVELARLVNMSLREKNDIFARWGGEEFVVLSRFTTNEEAELIANQLRKDIESYHFEVVQKVTCSFGVTQFQANDSKNDIFQRVDEALYEAKDNGRNQVIVK